MRRLTRRFIRPFSRSVVGLLAWTHRHTLRLWWRTFRDEVKRPGPIEVSRLRTLTAALWKLATDSHLANAPEVRCIHLVGDTLQVDVDPHWPKIDALRAALTEVAHVNRVDVGRSAEAAERYPFAHAS